MTLPATLDREAAAERRWDVVVVGAGPAGALAAHGLASKGLAVLLVDRAEFPRGKVCGGCLNGRALALLQQAGLGALPAELGARQVDAFLLAVGGSQARLPLPAGVAVSRQALDAALVRAAITAGADFLAGTRAALGEVSASERYVELHGDAESRDARTRLVLAADGLGGRLLRDDVAPAHDSRLGAGVLLDGAPDFYAPGIIHMACGGGGYVGLVRVEAGRLDVAAAFDPARCVAAGGPGLMAKKILREAGLPPLPDLETAAWRGTPLLTRRAPRLAAERLFVLGDAAGYVEPFTGEGIAWALASASAVVPLALEAVTRWDPALARRWAVAYREAVGGRQTLCRWLARLLRHPGLLHAVVHLLARAPFVAGPVVRRLNRARPCS